ncbi:MAG: RsiV family protein [Paludibacter sp.]|nr:RsiV family protein [Paludibacter sp.]MDD4427420.1 RsiV family protein [Paludibacter sp.]
MKTKKLLFIIAGITILLIILLVVFRSPFSTSIITKNFSLSDKVYLSEEDTTTGSLTIDLNIDLPISYQDKNVLDNIQTIIRTELFGDMFMSFPEDSLLNYYANELGREYIENNADFAKKISEESRLAFNNSIILEGFALLNDKNIFSYGISRFVDFGGAHPIKTRLFYNFELVNGKIIFEDEIFVEGYKPELTEIIKNKLLNDLNNDNTTPYIENFDDSVYFMEEIKPNGNFYINDESICFVFNPYEIAPYYVGETEVILPYKLIHHLMKPNNPLEYLVTAALNNN